MIFLRDLKIFPRKSFNVSTEIININISGSSVAGPSKYGGKWTQSDNVDSSVTLLNRNKRSKKESYIYPCDQCKYSAGKLTNLKRHKESRHEGIRYQCDQCMYAATTTSNLKNHKKSMHDTHVTNVNIQQVHFDT